MKWGVAYYPNDAPFSQWSDNQQITGTVGRVWPDRIAFRRKHNAERLLSGWGSAESDQRRRTTRKASAIAVAITPVATTTRPAVRAPSRPPMRSVTGSNF